MLSRLGRRLVSFEPSLLHSQGRYFASEATKNPKVYFDVEIGGNDEGRVVFEVKKKKNKFLEFSILIIIYLVVIIIIISCEQMLYQKQQKTFVNYVQEKKDLDIKKVNFIV